MHNRYALRTLKFPVDIEALNAVIGDRVMVQHNGFKWGTGIGGRLVSTTSGSVTLDQEYTIEAGLTYKIIVRLNTDVLAEREITNVPGTYTTFTVATAFSPVPAQYDVFALGQVDSIAKTVTITNISRSTMDQKFTLTGLEYAPEVYQYESTIPNLTSRSTKLLMTMQPHDVGMDDFEVAGPRNRTIKCIDIWWEAVAHAQFSHIEVWYRRASGKFPDWQYSGSTTGTTYQILNVLRNTSYIVALVPVSLSHAKLHIDLVQKHQIRTDDALIQAGAVANVRGGTF